MNKLHALIKKLSSTEGYKVEYIKTCFTEEMCRIMFERNIKRSELALKMGTSKGYITKIMRGSVNLTLEVMVRVAIALDMELVVELK